MHCRKATELLSQAQDRPLSLAQRLGLSLHLRLCRHCRNFSRQLLILRRSMKAWRKEIEE